MPADGDGGFQLVLNRAEKNVLSLTVQIKRPVFQMLKMDVTLDHTAVDYGKNHAVDDQRLKQLGNIEIQRLRAFVSRVKKPDADIQRGFVYFGGDQIVQHLLS